MFIQAERSRSPGSWAEWSRTTLLRYDAVLLASVGFQRVDPASNSGDRKS